MAERGERRQASRCCQGRGGAWAEPFSVPGKPVHSRCFLIAGVAVFASSICSL